MSVIIIELKYQGENSSQIALKKMKERQTSGQILHIIRDHAPRDTVHEEKVKKLTKKSTILHEQQTPSSLVPAS